MRVAPRPDAPAAPPAEPPPDLHGAPFPPFAAALPVVAVVALVALGATGAGLLSPGAALDDGEATVRRVVGLALAALALAALLTRAGRSARVGAGAVVALLFAAAALAAAVLAVTLPSSPVELSDASGPDDGGEPGTSTTIPSTPSFGGPVVDIPGDVDVVEGSDGPDFALPEGDVEVDPLGGRPARDGVRLAPTRGHLLVLEDDRLVRTESGERVATVGEGATGRLDLRGALLRLECEDDAVLVQADGSTTEVALSDLGLSERCSEPPVEPDGDDARAGDDLPDSQGVPVGQILLWGVVMVLLVVGLSQVPGLLGIGRARPGTGAPLGARGPLPVDAAVAEAGFVASIEAMLDGDDARVAIVAAYAALLEVLATAGAGRRPQEAPHEHLDRVLGPLGVRPEPLHELAERFVRARFSPHPVEEDDRRAALTLLEAARADLRPLLMGALT